MHLDHAKFLDLLCETSGIERAKAVKQLKQMIKELRSAIDDGDGYEIAGFGIFSKLGNNVVFIPSEELETEINYKYVGMEPIELPGSSDVNSPEEQDEDESNPIAGIIDAAGGVYEDPFAELLAEADADRESERAEEDVTSDIAAALENELEEDDANLEDDLSDLFGEETVIESAPEEESFLGDEIFENEDAEKESLDETAAEKIEEEESFDDPFETDEEEVAEAVEELIEDEEHIIEDLAESEPDAVEETELKTEDSPDEEAEAPGPESWGIDAHKEEGDEDVFGGMLGEEELVDDDISEEEDIDFSALEENEETTYAEDEDDPFDSLEDEDYVPVVTNTASEQFAEEDALDKDITEADKKTVGKRKKSKEGSPIFLYLILVLVILAAGTYGVGYFGVVNIPGITPEKPAQFVQNTPAVTPPVNPPVSNTEQPTEETVAATTQTASNTPAQSTPEQAAPTRVQADTPLRTNVETYGLKGSLSQSGLNGYTVVLYSLSKKEGADAEVQRLRNLGYRTIVSEVQSAQYGLLYRVSVGQFASLAMAADSVKANQGFFTGNYFISKIQ